MLGVDRRLRAAGSRAALVLQIHDDSCWNHPPRGGAATAIGVEEMRRAMTSRCRSTLGSTGNDLGRVREGGACAAGPPRRRLALLRCTLISADT